MNILIRIHYHIVLPLDNISSLNMGSIFLQIGQCGCQIGKKLNERLSQTYYATTVHTHKKVHAIMLDTQPKVLKPIMENSPFWMDPSNMKYFQYGRGNNWSYGYMHELPEQSTEIEKEYFDRQFLNKNGQKIQEKQHRQFSHLSKYPNPRDESPQKTQIQENPSQQQLTIFQQEVLLKKYLKENKQICQYALNRVRKQLDHTDCPLCINVICSLGGGTGSGLGTKLIEKIYEQFAIDTYAHVILPNKSGETPLQIYNCALSLASIQEHSTAIFPYQNDNMINMFLTGKQKSVKESKGNDLDLINSEISKIQSQLFKVNELDDFPRFYQDLVSDCILSNELKYVSVFGSSVNNPVNGHEFDESFQILCRQLRTVNEDIYSFEGIESKREKCLASSLLVTVPSSMKISKNVVDENSLKRLRTITNMIGGKQFHGIEQVKVGQKKKGKQSNRTQALFLMNHSNITRYLKYLSISGRKKYEAGAYLWHYKYADLCQAFDKIETVIDQYQYFG